MRFALRVLCRKKLRDSDEKKKRKSDPPKWIASKKILN